MKIKYLGHACFIITSDKGAKLIIDPYKTGEIHETGGKLSYGEINESADIVAVSHDHSDHSNAAAVKGNPEVVRGAVTGEIKGIKFKGIPSYHDDAEGELRGDNTIFCFEVDGVRVCHLGDLGHMLSDSQVAEIGKNLDILLVPVGGRYTIDFKMAGRVCTRLRPKVIIPMHYETDKSNMKLGYVDSFIRWEVGVKKPDSSEVEFKQGEFPTGTQVIVLKPAL